MLCFERNSTCIAYLLLNFTQNIIPVEESVIPNLLINFYIGTVFYHKRPASLKKCQNEVRVLFEGGS